MVATEQTTGKETSTKRVAKVTENPEVIEDFAGFQKVGGIFLLAGLGPVAVSILSPEVGVPLMILGLALVVRGFENAHKAGLVREKKSLPGIRDRLLGRLIYP